MPKILPILALFGLLSSTSAPARESAPRVTIAQGVLAGKTEGSISAYLGIPYAAPPIGKYRWRPPLPAAAWTGVRTADHAGPACTQMISPTGFGPWTHEYVVSGQTSEDCLSLNIWKPAKAAAKAKLPVLVWIHGGAFSQGSGAVPIYDGRALAERGIVVVTINYRLGVFGFLAHPDITAEANGSPPGNFGLQDQIAALRWVRHNITAFGGDPDQVTIAGQSAGSMSVHSLVASPLAKGLFARAIAQSGLPPLAAMPDLAKAEQTGLSFAQEKGAASLVELRTMPAEELLREKQPGMPRFFPIADGTLLPAPPQQMLAQGRFNDVPMIVGQNRDEASAMTPGYGAGDQASFTALLDRSFNAQADRFAALYPAKTEEQRSAASKEIALDKGLGSIAIWAQDRLTQGKAPVYSYLFSHVEPGPQSASFGAFHSSEIPYALDTLDASPERAFTAKDRQVSDWMSGYWINFIRTGNPNGTDRSGAKLAQWPQLTTTSPTIIEVDDKISTRALLPHEKLEAMKAFVASGGAISMF